LPAVVTDTFPVVALGGTVAAIPVWPSNWTTASMPLNFTEFPPGVSENPVPIMLTNVPSGPDSGEIDIIEDEVSTGSFSSLEQLNNTVSTTRSVAELKLGFIYNVFL
jgi:hypothetical protein